MERVKRLLRNEGQEQAYEPLEGGSERPDGERIEVDAAPFSWVDYLVFALLGVAMLWAWNMFLAATPYFQSRFESNEYLLRNFQSALMSFATVGNLGSMIVLTKLQARANYPKRIIYSLILYAVMFTLLALSTKVFLGVSAGVYFGFLMFVVLSASLGTGLCQNGVFAYVSGFGREEYTQGIMTGQGIAGVLPCIAQIISVLSVPENQESNDEAHNINKSAFSYFLTATGISLVTLAAFFYLLSRPSSKRRMQLLQGNNDLTESAVLRKSIPLTRLLKKLYWLAGAIFINFGESMWFPVFTGQIVSVRDPATASRLFQPASFIPLAIFFWSLGDLIGRTLPAIPALRMTHRPRLLFFLSVARTVFIPLYFLCNIGGRGAIIDSDFYYLFIEQLLFGTTGGYIGSNCMMGFPEYVEAEELEAAGSFMSLVLVIGLTVGSFSSFAVASV